MFELEEGQALSCVKFQGLLPHKTLQTPVSTSSCWETSDQSANKMQNTHS